VRAAALILAFAAAGCTHARQEVSCAAANLPGVTRAWPGIAALSDPPPATLEAGFVLCSRHEERLLAASTALGAEGYSSYIGAAKAGKCLRVARTHEASASALDREIRTMCRIAETHRIAYRHWQSEVAGKSVRLAGERMWIDGRASRLD
jgi:hypothetical protein